MNFSKKISFIFWSSIFSIFILVYPFKETPGSLLSEMVCRSYTKIERIIENSYPNCRLIVLEDLFGPLQDYFKTKYPDSHPGFLCSDFNGDGITDYAVLMRCEKSRRIVERFAVLLGKKGDSFHWFNIHEWNGDLYLENLFLRIIPPGEIKECETDSTIRLKLPGIELTLYEAASQVYYWDNGKFSFVQTSD